MFNSKGRHPVNYRCMDGIKNKKVLYLGTGKFFGCENVTENRGC
jgi:hypothetical protein